MTARNGEDNAADQDRYTGPLDWRTGHPDSPEIRAGVVAATLAAWGVER
ncbi:hypothetical protein ACFYY8_33370 [Streptosporangium sp. NPDC001559]